MRTGKTHRLTTCATGGGGHTQVENLCYGERRTHTGKKPVLRGRTARGCPCPGAGVVDERSHGWRSEVGIERAEGRMLGAGPRPATVSRSRRRDGGDGATVACPQGASGDGHGQPRAAAHQQPVADFSIFPRLGRVERDAGFQRPVLFLMKGSTYGRGTQRPAQASPAIGDPGRTPSDAAPE